MINIMMSLKIKSRGVLQQELTDTNSCHCKILVAGDRKGKGLNEKEPGNICCSGKQVMGNEMESIT